MKIGAIFVLVVASLFCLLFLIMLTPLVFEAIDEVKEYIDEWKEERADKNDKRNF